MSDSFPDPDRRVFEDQSNPRQRGVHGTPSTVIEDAPLVEARDLGRTYQRGGPAVVALASATCSVAPGDRIALLGPSGSGKSTLLHLMGGLDRPSAGEISWPALGAPETLRPAQVAFVFQMPSLLAPLSAVENVELPLLLDQVGAGAAREAALAALASPA